MSRSGRGNRGTDVITRQWVLEPHAAGDEIRRFLALMERGRGAGFVSEWDDGNGHCPWYNARPGAPERELRAELVALFGGREPVSEAEALRLLGAPSADPQEGAETRSEELWMVRSRRGLDALRLSLWTSAARGSPWVSRGEVVGEVRRGYPRTLVATKRGSFSLLSRLEEFE